MGNTELAARLDRLEACILNLSKLINTVDVPHFLDMCDMEALLRGKRTYILKLVEEGVLPQPRKLGGKNIWRRDEVLLAVEKALENSQK